ncbi:MAG: hypothetical protein HYX65_13055 [Gemmatimonadetes bacterium]|nr:hypothetical protein [Gemmatimonadota bacterium]
MPTPRLHNLTLAAAVALLVAPATACGQKAPERSIPAARGTVCDASMRVVAIRVVDSAGRPVNDARVELRRAKDGAVVVTRTGATSSGGDYVLFDDPSAPAMAKGGENFTLSVTSGSRKSVVTLVLGRTEPDGCHVAVLKGDQRIVLP